MPDSADIKDLSAIRGWSVATEAPQPPARISARLVLLLGALTGFVALSVDMYLPALPSIGQQLGGLATDGQITLATFFAGLAIGQFFYGPASDRWGRRGPLLIGILIYALASAACALATSIPLLAAARFVQALGGSAGPVIARAAVRDRFNARDSARVLSLLMLVMGVAPILAPFCGAALLTVFNWRAIFGVLTLFSVIMGACVYFGLRETRTQATADQARGEHPVRGYLTLLRNPVLVGYMMSGAFNSAAVFAYVSDAPNVVMGFYGIRADHFVWVFGSNAASMIAMSQLNAHLLRRSTPEKLLTRVRPFALLFAGVMALDAATGFGGMWGVLAPLFCLFGTFGFILSNTMAAGLGLDRRRAGSISAMMGGVQFGVGALIAAAIAATGDSSPRPLAYAILVAMIGSTIALYAVEIPKRKARA